MKIIIHTAEMILRHPERIFTAGTEKQEVLKAAREWKRDHPGRRVKYGTIVEEVER